MKMIGILGRLAAMPMLAAEIWLACQRSVTNGDWPCIRVPELLIAPWILSIMTAEPVLKACFKD